MEVSVHGVVAVEVSWVLHSVFGDPAFQRCGAVAELAKGFVQTVTGAVLAQVELVGGYVAAALQRVRLEAVHLGHAIKVVGVEVIDFRAWKQFLDHDNGVSDLRCQLCGGSGVAHTAKLVGNGKRPVSELLNRDVRAPLQHTQVAVGPSHIGGADLSASTRTFH